MTRIAAIGAILALALLNAAFAVAQVATGTPPFASLGGGPFDTINLGNLNVHFAIPIVHKAGRGGSNFTYDVGYDNSVWYPVTVNGVLLWQPTDNWGWHFQTEAVTGFITYTTTDGGHACFFGSQYYGEEYIYSNWTYHDAAGAAHVFGGSAIHYAGAPAYCPPDQYLTATSDGWTLTSSNLKLVGDSGQIVYPPVNTTTGLAQKYDANGNAISVDGSGNFFDTLSSTTPVLTVTGSGTSTSPWKFGYIPPSGTRVYAQANYVQYTVKTNFGFSSPRDYGPNTISLVDNVTLADGSKYSFTYEQTPGTCTPVVGPYCVTGRIHSVTLPTGGTITYAYSGGSNGSGIFTDGSTGTLSRTLSPGGTATYARSQVSGSHWQTTITDPSTPSNQTQVDFQAGPASNFYETQRLVYQGSTSGTLLSTTITCYNNNPTPSSCPTTAVSGVGERSVYNYLPDVNGQQSETYVTYNGSGLPYLIINYDYGSGHVGSVLRQTSIAYGSYASGNCSSLGNGILDHVCQVEVYTNSGNDTSNTYYSYDETTATAPTGTTPQHISISGSRGNLTTLRTVVNSTTSLYRKFTNYDTGNIHTASDAGTTSSGGANLTTYNYPDATSTCGNAFPSSISEPGSLSRSFTWSCVGGVNLTTIDENTNSITTDYTDPYFWRPDYTQDQLLNQTTFSYISQTATEAYLKFNSNNSVSDMRTTVDAFGRVILSQQAQTPALAEYDTSETDYNLLGQPSKSTIPFQATGGTTNPSAPGTTTVYDALGRPSVITDGGTGTISYSYPGKDVLQVVSPAPAGENTKQKQLEYDGLGRLASVCEILTTGGTTCAQNSAASGYKTSYAYSGPTGGGGQLVVTQGAQTRTYVQDELGRLISETNPESGTTATTYDYDSISGGHCGALSEPGHLVRVTYANGTYKCFFYTEPQGRLTDVEAYGGSGGALCQRYRYDYPSNAIFTAPGTIGNAAGRIVEAETDNCATWPPTTATRITDEWFSYDKDGNVTDMWELTPHSGLYYHSYATFAANGVPLTVQLAAPSLYTMTYGLDGEGRPFTLKGNSTTIVSNTQFNPASQPLNTYLGTGTDQSDYGYDPNTGRMTSWLFQVGSPAKSQSGTISWNANGTPRQLAIVDGFNAGGSQTCTFGTSSVMGYDDLGRLLSDNCGSVWAQTFTYDQYGNVTKAGSSAWNPGYNPANNHYSSGASYDASGNLTWDSIHSYAWNSDNKLASVDSTSCASNGECVTYDAFQRIVETSYNGTYTEIWYTQSGRVYMHGSSPDHAYWKSPGNGIAQVNQNAATLYYTHTDWLGNARINSVIVNPYVVSDQAYAPFGEVYNKVIANIGVPAQMFTGDTQDTLGGVFDTPNRELNASQGRWLSPDPSGLAAVDPTQPKSWNRYAYVLNNPLSAIDPLGLSCAPGEDGTWYDNGDGLGCGLAGQSVADNPINPDTVVNVTDSVTGDPANISLWGTISDFLKNNWFSASVFIPDLPILVDGAPVGVIGHQYSLQWNISQKSLCGGLSLGVAFPPGGKSFQIGPLNVGNTQATKGIIKGWSVGTSVQPTPYLGGQMQTSSPGSVGGLAVGTPGVALTGGYSVCN